MILPVWVSGLARCQITQIEEKEDPITGVFQTGDFSYVENALPNAGLQNPQGKPFSPANRPFSTTDDCFKTHFDLSSACIDSVGRLASERECLTQPGSRSNKCWVPEPGSSSSSSSSGNGCESSWVMQWR